MRYENDYNYQNRNRCGKTMDGNMMPEEFAWRMKERGIVTNIQQARDYVKNTGKMKFLEADLEKDMEDAWRYFDTGKYPRCDLSGRKTYDYYEGRWWGT